MTPLAGTALLWLALCRPLPVAVGAAGVGVAAHVLRGLWRPVNLPLGWWFALFVAANAAVVGWGAMVQARRAVIASLRERAWRAEAEQARRVDEARRAERGRIAREMHDVLAHRLSLLATSAGALEYRPDAPPDQLARAAGVVRDGAHQALDELREVIGLLRDDADPSDDARGRPQPTLTDLPRLIEESRAAGMSVQVDDRVDDGSALPATVGRAAYRVVQEGLTNARRHASGAQVRLTVRGSAGDGLTVDLRNPLADGVQRSSGGGSGNGLIGLAERVRLAGGHLHHEVTAGGEFRLSATLPWPA
jgi:signal transduction histidine kinase